jgi:hypothetical protein
VLKQASVQDPFDFFLLPLCRHHRPGEGLLSEKRSSKYSITSVAGLGRTFCCAALLMGVEAGRWPGAAPVGLEKGFPPIAGREFFGVSLAFVFA